MEKFFTFWPEDSQEKGEKLKVHINVRKKNLINWKFHAMRPLMDISLHLCCPPVVSQDTEEMDLEMLAPYISMDDDFQLTFLSSLSEDEDKHSAPLSTLSTALTVSNKRYHRISTHIISHILNE